MTQLNEPFIEPWLIDLEIKQVNDKNPFEIQLTSKKLLYFILNYGMAVSIRNIFAEIVESIHKVDNVNEILAARYKDKNFMKLHEEDFIRQKSVSHVDVDKQLDYDEDDDSDQINSM